MKIKNYFARLKGLAHQIDDLNWYSKETFKHGYEIKFLLGQLEQTYRDQLQQIQELKASSPELNVPIVPDHILAYDPDLIPPNHLLKLEGVMVMEEWFRWAEEWSWYLRNYGELESHTKVLEIGCGLGRIAYPLRFLLSSPGSYDGFEIERKKVDFLQANFQKKYPNFRFTWADIHNTYYNPNGKLDAKEYIFPYSDASFDVIYAASVYTHLLPDYTAHYFKESARVLKKGGKCVFSFFLLDNYQAGRPRPNLFADPMFNFDFEYQDYGDQFSITNPANPEEITGYRLSMIETFAKESGLALAQAPIDGIWSGKVSRKLSTQDMIILTKE